MNDTFQLGRYLASVACLREHLRPQPGNRLDLYLGELRLAKQRVATNEAVRILDFGCGGSPCRGLFPDAACLRADIAGMPDPGFTVSTDAPEPQLSAPDAGVDPVFIGFCQLRLRHVVDRLKAWWHRRCDEIPAGHRLVLGGLPAPRLEIGIGCVATER